MEKRNRSSVWDAALEAIRVYGDEDRRGIPCKTIPIEVCDGAALDLSAWSLVATDECLRRIAATSLDHAICSGALVGTPLLSSVSSADMASSRQSESKKCHSPSLSKHECVQQTPVRELLRLNLCGAQYITDSGLKFIAPACPALKWLSLENACSLTASGLESVVKVTSQLEFLSLSGCTGMSGAGYGIIGARCTALKTLLLAGCNKIKPSALIKIFEGCNNLETLDLSYCPIVSDSELKFLAENCSMLKDLNLNECQQISDIGIFHISSRCSSLRCLHLGRTSLPYRITDIALMSLGEKCRFLKKINMSGCEMITDAGIAWLAKGCSSLSYVNLTGCSKVTNGGMRHLGENCPGLMTVILVNVKRVSDVGIRLIAQGCQLLETLNAGGLYLLSDGIKRDFGLEGLQALGTAKCAESLKVLNLQDCFQISTIALKAISALTNLETLVLSGCTNLSIEGMSVIALRCKEIETLLLSNCGTCCCDKMVERLASGLQKLSKVSFAGCEKIGRKAMKALSTCGRLSHLDLTGCTFISDEDLLPLCESSYDPGLESLILSDCKNVGNMALAWISESLAGAWKGDQDAKLTTLALKSTRVTSLAAKAERGRFPYSELISNKDSFGFFPLPRINDRRTIHRFARKQSASLKIQAVFRGDLVRRRTYLVKEQRARHRASVVVQLLWLSSRAKCVLRRLKQHKANINCCATCLQRLARMTLAKSLAVMIRQDLRLKKVPIKATQIQRIFRGLAGRRRASFFRGRRDESKHERNASSIIIQCCVRCFAAKAQRLELARVRNILESTRDSSLKVLQTFFRVFKSKRVTKRLKQWHLNIIAKQCRASIDIVRVFKTRRFRRVLYERIMRTQNRSRKATIIETAWRVKLAVKDRHDRQKSHAARLIWNASIVVQRRVRCRAAYLDVRAMHELAQSIAELRESKGKIIRRWWTCVKFHQKLDRLRIEHHDRLRRILELQTFSSTAISSAWRGKKGREKAAIARYACKARWKQLWCEEEARAFYYNQVTAETSWMKPQALLDLQPRPVCSNCGYFEAKVECANCAEFFCQQCYDAVHYGGKRSLHHFRALFDFYGHRLDHGDGEFPSIWPTEVEQDENLT